MWDLELEPTRHMFFQARDHMFTRGLRFFPSENHRSPPMAPAIKITSWFSMVELGIQEA